MFVDFIVAMMISMFLNSPLSNRGNIVETVQFETKVSVMDIIDNRIVKNYLVTGKLPETESDEKIGEAIKTILIIPEVDIDDFYYKKVSPTSFELWIVDLNGNLVYSKNSHRNFPLREAEIF